VDDAQAGAVEDVAQIAFGELVEVRAVFAREDVFDFVDQAVVIGGDEEEVSVGGHDALEFEQVVERVEEVFEDFEVRERGERVVGEFVGRDIEVGFTHFDFQLGLFGKHVAHVAFAGADVEPSLFERVVLRVVQEQPEQSLRALFQCGIVEVVVGSDSGIEHDFIVVDGLVGGWRGKGEGG
jgi:hypothetical protein